MADRKQVILDCDPGVDDAHCILMALAAPNIDLIAITTVHGNTDINNTTSNALRVLKFTNKLNIPVFRGSAKSLIGLSSVSSSFHGIDGLGDIVVDGVDPLDSNSLVQPEHAALALVRLVNTCPGKITLLATGPLTNIAVAMTLDPTFTEKLQDFIIMGGNYKGSGNITPTAEVNFYLDPEAAHAVLSTSKQMITIVPLETCEANQFSWEWYKKYTSASGKKTKFFKEISGKLVESLKNRRKDTFTCWDQFAMAIVIDKRVIREAVELYAVVELHGQNTRGQMVLDWRNKLQQQHNVKIVIQFNMALFEELLRKSISD